MECLSNFKVFTKNCQGERSAFLLRIEKIKSSLTFSIQIDWILVKQINDSHHELRMTMSDSHMHECVLKLILSIKFGACIQQKFGDFKVTIISRKMQGR